MKFHYSKASTVTQPAATTDGRYIGTVIQIADLGNQPAFNVGDPPDPSVGVVIQVAGAQVFKRMRITNSPYGTLTSFFNAALPAPDEYEGDEALQLTLGRPIAVEIVTRGQFTNIASFHRPETFEVGEAPIVDKSSLVMLNDVSTLSGNDAEVKALFMSLHRDIRSAISKRVKERV